MKLTLFSHDLSSNAFGRAYLLADVLRRTHDVEVVGPTFGDGLWPPCANPPFPVRAYPGGRWPGFCATAHRIAREAQGQLLLAVKAMPTSYGLALLARRQTPRPLILDTDDWELGFYEAEEEERGLSGPVRFVKGLLPGRHPNSKALVALMERLTPLADAGTTVSDFLRHRYRPDALIVPHARDTDALDPARFPPDEARRRLGLDGLTVVMFLGTAHPHKGVEDLVEAVASLARPATTAVLVGTPPEAPLIARLAARFPGTVRAFGPVPFPELPAWLAAAHVVVLPQRQDVRAAGQVPAKLTDALALAKPVILTDLPPQVDAAGGAAVVVPPGDPRALASALAALLDDPARQTTLAAAARHQAVHHLGYGPAARALDEAIALALEHFSATRRSR
ncbi:MAG: glycosyltransferase [Candidatus Wallbacteria bacterium]|nr:glycosyltransferase [Candidatus Wallbacteria bacterium]